MERNPSALSKTRFDLVVIGGGINGAAVAREAALRGLKVALVEAGDFASGTSSRSSKLIHGGLRYLEQFDFRLVRESRLERRILHHVAPHLAQPLPFLLPIYEGDPYFPLKIRAGLTLYDWLGNLGHGDRHRMLKPEEAEQLVPPLRSEGLRAGAVYYDSATDDARLTIEMILDAVAHGAAVVNHAEVRTFAAGKEPEKQAGEIVAAEVYDRIGGGTFQMESRFWINATGPWVDRVRARVPGYDGSPTVRLTKGTHLIISQVSPQYAVFAAIPKDGRVFLLIPWNGYSLLGTTDTEFAGDPASVCPEPSDIDYLLQAVNRVLRQPIGADQVAGSFAGLRALVIEPGASPSSNTREHRFHRDPWVRNFVSICGGKLTTARALGEKLLDEIGAELGPGSGIAALGHPSREAVLPGGHTGPFESFVQSSTCRAVSEYGLPSVVAERIVRTYGSRWPQVLALIQEDKAFGAPLPGSPTFLAAEVEFAIRHEMAMTVEDFLLRRSGLNWAACTPGCAAAAPAVAQIFARRFGWDDQHRRKALRGFEMIVNSGA